MPLKKIFITAVIASTALFAADGEEVYKNYCASCHMMKMGWQVEDKSTLKAPTIYGVANRVRNVFSNEKMFVKFVSNYITHPSRIKARCKDEAIDRFGIMPPVGQGMREEEKKEVARWMFHHLTN
jgi:cytochrome c5